MKLEVSKRLYELVMGNCMRASEKGFNLSDMISGALSSNARMTINGQDIRTDRERLDVESVMLLVVARYCIAYVSRYAAEKVVEYFVQQENDKRNNNKLSFLGLCSYVVDALFREDSLKSK